jgi:hypothetical protein
MGVESITCCPRGLHSARKVGCQLIQEFVGVIEDLARLQAVAGIFDRLFLSA